MLLSALGLLCVTETKANNHYFKHVSVRNGLSNNHVRDIVKDERGFVWIATVDGLCRYDGYNVKQYKQFNVSSIHSNFINDLFIDSDGNIWVATAWGLSRYNEKTDDFTTYHYSSEETSLSSDFVNNITEDKENIWLATDNGISKLHKETKEISRLTIVLNGQEIESKVRNIECFRGSIYFDINNYGLVEYSLVDESFKLLTGLSISDSSFYFIKKIENDLWLGSRSGRLFRYSKNNFVFNEISLRLDDSKHPYVFKDVTKDNSNNIWLAVDGIGVVSLNSEDNSINEIIRQKKDHTGLKNEKICCIYVCNQNVLWAGSCLGGISFSPLSRTRFEFVGKSQRYEDLNAQRVNCIYENEKGQLLIGTNGGSLNMRNKEGVFSYIPYDNNVQDCKECLSIFDILSIGRDTLLIGTYKNGVLQYKNGKLTKPYFADILPPLPNEHITGLEKDSKGNIWIANESNGLYMVSMKNKTCSFFGKEKNDWKVGSFFYDIIFDKSKHIWIATNHGLARLDIETKQIKNYLFPSPSEDIPNAGWISNNNINCLYIDKDNVLWAGTQDGLNIYDAKRDSFYVYSKNDGLPSSNIKSIAQDNQGVIWLSTTENIVRFSQHKYLIKYFNYLDGVECEEFMPACSYFSKKTGRMYFGGSSGYVSFYPKNVKHNNKSPQIIISALNLFHKKVEANDSTGILTKDISVTDTLFLDYKQNNFSLEFVALNYIFTEKNKYAYTLEGFDKNITVAGSERKAVYTNVPPGKYLFKVTAANNDGLWNITGKGLVIIIDTPWWQTIPAIILFVLLIIGIMFALYFYRSYLAKKQNQQLENIVRERTNELRQSYINLDKLNRDLSDQKKIVLQSNDELKHLNLMKDRLFSIIGHDLKNPINSIKGFAELTAKRFDSIDEEKKKYFLSLIIESTKQVSQLLDNLLDWARTQTTGISYSPSDIDLVDLIQSNIRFISQLSNNKEVDVIFDSNHKNMTIYADENLTNTIFRNLLTNAIKYTPSNGRVLLSVETETGKNARITIADNGIGMSSDQLNNLFKLDKVESQKGTNGETGTGLGLILCKEFVEKQGGSISVLSKKGFGTTVSFSIPLA